jgi:mannitol-1-/sugar-/sorbitol-6-phosphatase
VTAPKTLVLNKPYAAFLFDMDGTILNSIVAAERVWTKWAQKHGLDVATFLPTIHGVRGFDTISNLGLPGVDPQAETEQICADEIVDLEGIVPIAGAIAFLNSLPRNRWAIVTSAPKELALVRMAKAGIPRPDIMVTGEDVTQGKPNPRCFMLGAEKLGVDIADCLVFEDAPAGILAGEASGASVVVITATHIHKHETALATIPDYTGYKALTGSDGRVSITLQT